MTLLILVDDVDVALTQIVKAKVGLVAIPNLIVVMELESVSIFPVKKVFEFKPNELAKINGAAIRCSYHFSRS